MDEDEREGSTLMRIIRSLSAASDSGEEREEEKRRLELRFRESDERADDLVAENRYELASVTKAYARVSKNLASARKKVKGVKESLKACRELLHYKRDELKRLWLDGLEQKYILQLLEQIETIKECPEKIECLLSKKKYLEATKQLVQNLSSLNNDLKDVEGLIELKTLLISKKETLYKTLLTDLSRQLYAESTYNILQLRRQASTRENPFQRAGSNRGSSGGKGSGRNNRDGSGRRPGEMIKTRRLYLDSTSAQMNGRLMSVKEEEEWMKILDNPALADLSLGPTYSFVIDIECLSQLNMLPGAVEHLRSELRNELQAIVRRTSQLLIESGPYPQGDSRLLSELFNAVVEQLYLVVDGYRLIALVTNAVCKRNESDIAKLDKAEVWARVQSVVQTILTDYLNFKNKSRHQPNVQFSSETTGDMNSYFLKRKNQRPKRSPLFKFEYSSTALSMSDYTKEQNQDEDNPEKILVCPPNPHNITPIYSALMEFVCEIEKALKCSPGSHCTLYTFLTDYIKDVFLAQIHVDNGETLNVASASLDSWKSETEPDVLRELEVSKPLLSSTIGVKLAVDDLYKYMNTLPLYSQHFLTYICKMVMQYREICQAAYRGIVQPESEDKRIISAQWAKDQDISRFLKSLPSWVTRSGAPPEQYSLRDLELRSAKETLILRRNLGVTDIPFHEILSEPNQLRCLAQLQESLDWFSQSILKLSGEFQNWNSSNQLLENSIQTLISHAKEFEELSDTCLLVLHLEVRVHCFYYLYPIWTGPGAGAQFHGGPDSTDPNAEVVRLARDLTAIEDALAPVLRERKARYIFEGVSHLVGAILVGSTEHLKKINSNGVKKMCRNLFTVQHTLTSNITGTREVALESAKQYFELFNKRPQDIINGIVEKGPLFTRDEYGNALKLIQRSSRNYSSQALALDLEKLKEIMKSSGVAV